MPRHLKHGIYLWFYSSTYWLINSSIYCSIYLSTSQSIDCIYPPSIYLSIYPMSVQLSIYLSWTRILPEVKGHHHVQIQKSPVLADWCSRCLIKLLVGWFRSLHDKVFLFDRQWEKHKNILVTVESPIIKRPPDFLLANSIEVWLYDPSMCWTSQA